ncbi:MAG TPA: LD-carboxypeptidase [Candidatus Polarisedimenticolia bacterium]|nr:LD-carboxypeptidase [Candidatus Polarisedimenticolia bacterium]
MSSPSAPRIKPPAVRLGDTLGIVAPASNVKRADLEAGCEGLRRAGYRPFYFDSILEQDVYFAGSVERRTRELEAMFAREDVKAIVCARGGYGANYLLGALDLEKIKLHPKIFVGYSDLTALLTYFSDVGGFVTFHGPMVAKDWVHEAGVHLASWHAALAASTSWELDPDAASTVTGLVDGAAEGILYGGCLSILVASLGTPYEIRTQGTILFLEDVAAKPYQIDRMLMQLKLSGKLAAVRGIIFGEMRDCVQTAHQGYKLEEVVLRIVGDLGIPVAYGLRSGHVTAGNITLPIGVNAGLSVRNGRVELKILEAAVTAAPAKS